MEIKQSTRQVQLGRCCGLLLLVTVGSASASEPTADQVNFFEAKVRPLLVERCYDCHSVESGESEGGLLVDSAAGLLKGGTLGSALIPGRPEQSRLFRAVTYRNNDLQMPPDGKLSDEEIATLRSWIEMGAPDPRDETEVQPEHESPLQRDPSTHWAFRKPERTIPPRLEANDSRDPIDDFAVSRAAELGLRPRATAAKETLVRRLYFDLTGLPPSRDAIEHFVNSDRPDAYTRLVDQLLASPEFGERFGRHWLDVARYADTVGYALGGRERRLKGSERFRDWTIHAIASDMPYDEMLRHQLAADRTDPNNEQGNLDAMGFLTVGRRFLSSLDTLDDRIDVISRGLLAMTVSCARCHDHKFDPIPASDYYALGGILSSSQQPKEGASPLMMVDSPNPADSHVLLRGQRGNNGPIAPRQFLTALRRPDEPRFTDGSGRWELAQRITASDNPLTARVMVNRLWGHLVGKPLVDTPSDFGFRTEAPAVPEVLDNLAAEFAGHWSIKRIVRRIVTSRIYRQSAEASAEDIELDPDNRYLARANRKRRDFESLRDSLLSVSDSLDRSIGGGPVNITLDTISSRRTIYAMIDRQNLPALFRTFDFASPDTHSPGRYFTTVPQQALFLLNHRQMLELARRTASLVRQDVGSDDPHRLVTGMFDRVYGRQPTDEEASAVVEFLSQPVSVVDASLDSRALWSYGTATIGERDRVVDFTPFPIFNEGRWQAAKEFPTKPPMSYAYLGSEAGHTPHDTGLAVVRRFTAPFSGQFEVRGQMGHRSEEGDGVRTSIWIDKQRVFQGTQKSNNRPYGPLGGRVEAGQTIDFVSTAGGSDSFDSFYWRMNVRLIGSDGRRIDSDSTKDFSGPFDPESSQPLDRLAQLAHTLLMSNEFAFVD